MQTKVLNDQICRKILHSTFVFILKDCSEYFELVVSYMCMYVVLLFYYGIVQFYAHLLPMGIF